MALRINGSITDFPVYTSMESFFKGFKKTGVNGVEIVGGYKNRWAFEKLFFLSKKYALPIVSFHQPAWSGLGLYTDKAFFKNIVAHNVKKVTLHPLTFVSFSSRFMKRYFSTMEKIQKEYGITFLLENMPNESEYTKLFEKNAKDTKNHLQTIYEIGKAYGFGFTYDVSHAEFIYPQKKKIFLKMLPSIGVIHLSSFFHKSHHLPLYEGEFALKEFLAYLKKSKFTGDIVLEINASLLKRIIFPYDFEAIARSVALIRQIEKKL